MAQCLGMADGLKKIHHHRSWSKVSGSESPDGERLGGKNRGQHGDIKPENILWYDSDDRLVIADFGPARLHSSNAVSLTYRPPEADLDVPLLQRYDVWSLGCLYLEFITWYLVGHEKTRGEHPKSFARERILDDRKEDRIYPEDKFFNLYPSSSQSLQLFADIKGSVRQVSCCILRGLVRKVYFVGADY
jgi:serine/threonine protein kinase